MAILNFPDTTGQPTDGSFTYTENDVIYVWDGEKWSAGVANSLVDTFVNRDGDTMTGDLTVPNLISEGDVTADNVQTNSLNGGPLAGLRNQIINGKFEINQRQGTRTPGVGVYGFDRWKGHANGLEQVVEGLPAGEYTLSWTGGGTGTFGGTTAVSPITATVPFGNTSVIVPQNATLVQLEPGPVVTPFEHRPMGLELHLCERYYYKAPDSIWRLYQSGSSRVQANFWFPTTMRATPTCTLFNVAASPEVTSVTANDANPRGFLAVANPNNATLPGTVEVYAGTYSGEAEL